MSRLKNAETKELFQLKGNKETWSLGSACGSGGNPVSPGSGWSRDGTSQVEVWCQCQRSPLLTTILCVRKSKSLFPRRHTGVFSRKQAQCLQPALRWSRTPLVGRGWGTRTQSRTWPPGRLGTRGQGCSGGPRAGLASVSEFAMKQDKGKRTPN